MPDSPARTAVGAPRHGVRRPVPTAPTVTGGLLAQWHARNRDVTLPHAAAMLEEWGNLDNLRRLTGESDADFRGMLFADSDIYKTLDAIAWERGRAEDPRLRDVFDNAVALIERAQQPDGYLDSAFLRQDRAPWSDLAQGHELYCLGHLIQAAVAAHRALGDDRLLAVAERFVAHAVDRVGGPDATEYCGHPLIETALIELHRTTGASAPLELAEAFLHRRGSGLFAGAVFGAAYYQDDQPALEAPLLRGHAVRALYLAQGIVDLHLETGDAQALATARAQWEDLVRRRLYVTGATGSRYEDEAFGAAYELPADRAYAETCAGVALFGWAWRMYLATGAADALDVAETALYNVVAAGIAASGDAFTYVNPLQVRDERPFGGPAPAERRRWFSCACCPPNLARTFATLEHYLATESADGADIALYGSAEMTLHGARVAMSTEYPVDGLVRIRVSGDASPGRRRLSLRVPAWARDRVRIVRDGGALDVALRDGWADLDDALQDGTTIELDLGMTTDAVHPHPRLDAVRGSIAVRRGPVVYCAVQADNSVPIDDVRIDPARVADAGAAASPATLTVPGELLADAEALPLYGDGGVGTRTPATVTLRPFADFDGGTAMRVWLPVA